MNMPLPGIYDTLTRFFARNCRMPTSRILKNVLLSTVLLDAQLHLLFDGIRMAISGTLQFASFSEMSKITKEKNK